MSDFQKNIEIVQGYLKPIVLFKAVFAGYFLMGMHYFQYNTGGYGLYLPYNVVGWMFVGTLIGLGFWQISRSGIIVSSKTMVLAWIGFLFFMIPLLYSINEISYRTVPRILFMLGGLAFYSALVQFRFSNTEKITFLYFILGAVAIESFLGLIQYYGLGSENYFLLMKKTRPYGIFQQVNIVTTFMATGIGISLYLVGKDPGLVTSIWRRWLVFLVPLTATVIIISIKSKAGYAGLFVILLLQLPFVKIGLRFYRLWFIMLFIGLAIGWLSPTVHQSIQQEDGLYTRSMANQISSVNRRLLLFTTTFNIWKDNPITGVGYGKFPKLYREYSASRRAKEPGFDYDGGTFVYHPHNEILLWLSEGGIAPLVGLLIFAGTYLIMVFRVHWKDALPSLALVMPILLHTQFEYPFDLSLAHWITFLLLVYLPDIRDTNQYRSGLCKAMIIPAVCVPLLLYYNMGKTLRNNSILTQFKYTGRKDYGLLLQIKDPGLLQVKYDDFILKALLYLGLETKNKETLQLFLEKGEEFLMYTPRLHVYEAMEIALMSMGREEEAQAMAERARYLFPNTYKELHEYQQSPSNKTD